MYDFSTSSNQEVIISNLEDLNSSFSSFYSDFINISYSIIFILLFLFLSSFIRYIFFGGDKH